MMLVRRSIAALVFLIVIPQIGGSISAQVVERPYGLDFLTDSDPLLVLEEIVFEYSAELIPIWKMGLEHDEAELQRRLAEVVFDVARRGMKGLDVLTPSLRNLAAGPVEDRTVQLAALRALTAIGDKPSASKLYELSLQLGCDAAEVLEPKLAQWKYEPIYSVWRARLEDSSVERRYRVFALRGLTAVGDQQTAAPAIRLATNKATSSILRLEAARAAARLQTSGSETVVEQLILGEPDRIDRLVAATLLSLHDGEQANGILLQLAQDASPAVQRIAIEQLLETAANKLLKLHADLIVCPDAKIRELAVLSLLPFPTAEHAETLSPVLNDHHPDVRNEARRTLVSFASKSDEMRVAVIAAAVKQLQGDSWRSQQQAARLVGQLDHEPSAVRCLELLSSNRREVLTTAAWALRKMLVEDSLSPALDYASQITQEIRAGKVDPRIYSDQLSLLFQFFGVLRYEKSVQLLLLHVPKNSATEDSRVGAIWGLGQIYRDGPPEGDLDSKLIERLRDTNPMQPELDTVRAASAVALGRMKAESALPSLRFFYEAESTLAPAGYASGWAIEQITGETIVMTHRRPEQLKPFFLRPYRD